MNENEKRMVCTVDSFHELTKGKKYDIIDKLPISINNHMYKLVNDCGKPEWYDVWALTPIEEWRDERLSELGI